MLFNIFPKTPKPQPADTTDLIKISGCDNPKRCGDIIFIHGLGGSARGTWHPEERQDDDNFWLTWLAQERPDLGIWSFGYQAEASEWKGSTMPLFDRAKNLQEYLAVNHIGNYPIIFIVHSMGGLLIKKMLRNAHDIQNTVIIEQTKGIVFLSTPHTGSHLANLINNIGTLARTTVSVDELRANEPQLIELNDWYRDKVDSLKIATKVYFEKTRIKGILVVDASSANPGIKGVQPIPTDDDHISITKPKSPNNLVYMGVSQFIQQQLQTNLTIFEQPTPTKTENKSAIIYENPDGQVPLNSHFYIERPEVETKSYESILQPGALIRIKAPQKMGKTSLISRILDHSKQKGYRTVSLNLWSQENLTDLNNFLQGFCAILSEELGLEEQIDKYWKPRLSSQINCTNYLKKYLLKNIDAPLVLGLDDIDQIFPYTEIAQAFFALLRAWHENGKNEEIWQKLRLVIAHSQESYISLNVNQSPFNVGLSVEIGEFNATQIKELVQRHKLNWSDPEIEQLRGMIDGHPYLLRTALYQIATGNLTLEQFLKVAPTDEGLYKGFLRHYLALLEEDESLKRAMQKVIKSDIPVELDSAQSFKLRSLGLIEFKGNQVQCPCNLYRLYFRERLSQ
ncbi:AAA-like domain-containing protein [Nodularia spumigena CS-591/12]|uniref:AAA-like domain-containing protein n=1 Tax=Nodularia spumigena TaxID=70799 RepID=UPI00232FD31F|nr:AAA-like domain-containing protein [Nodularia spumigena]MDB9303442.1 AAA-like domain-containing protein [Nodularia spumigena CS-591/12]MDB9343879.1 AAA-like domain-containing protein [Nodularia spumigena CS-588/06]MDB9367857.1 AAA-like domain-containing protein [Nodularia spumigena CS-586/05]